MYTKTSGIGSVFCGEYWEKEIGDIELTRLSDAYTYPAVHILSDSDSRIEPAFTD